MQNIFSWILILLALCGIIYIASDVIFPFVMAIIIAYALNPIIEKLPISRTMSSGLIILLFFLLLSIVSFLTIPKIYDQFVSFAHKIPEFRTYLQHNIIPDLLLKLEIDDQILYSRIKEFFTNFSNMTLKITSNFLQSIWSSGITFINIISLFLLTPILTFYISKDYVAMKDKITKILPKKHASEIIKQFSLIDESLSAYVRGQSIVCLIVAIYYCLTLKILGLNFGILIGLIAGITCFIPYVGFILSFASALIIAIIQFTETSQILLIAAVFIAGHLIESFYIVPKIVGNKIGISPIWLIFGTFLGGSLFGFIGILLAIPLMTVISVISKFLLDKYLNSNLYKLKD